MGKASRAKAQRRAAPPPVGKNRSRVDRRLLVAAGVAALVVLGAVVGAVVAFAGGGSSKATPIAQAKLAGLQTGPAPWSRNVADLKQRLDAIGLPALTSEGTVLHIHQHLDLFVNGRKVAVPAGIGIEDNEFISTIHTHDPSGVIHVESPTSGTFSLGQFFAIWGVRFTRTQVGGYRGYTLYVNGKRYTGDPTRLVLASHQELALVVGKRPAHVPSRYAFPPGE